MGGCDAVYMTEAEIYRDYRQAKHKSRQISILADLNGCSKEEIEAVIAKYEKQNEVAAPAEAPPPEVPLPEVPLPEQAETGYVLSRLYEELDQLNAEIRRLEEQYKETTIAIKVLAGLERR